LLDPEILSAHVCPYNQNEVSSSNRLSEIVKIANIKTKQKGEPHASMQLLLQVPAPLTHAALVPPNPKNITLLRSCSSEEGKTLARVTLRHGRQLHRPFPG
jgi:hypothetical protein